MNFSKENLRKINERLMAEIPDASDDEILHQNYEKIDGFSELSLVSFSIKPIEVRNFDAKNLSTGRSFRMMEMTRENLPKVLEILQRESPKEPDDQILDKNYEKLDYMSEDKPICRKRIQKQRAVGSKLKAVQKRRHRRY